MKTPKTDIDLIEQRLKALLERYRNNARKWLTRRRIAARIRLPPPRSAGTLDFGMPSSPPRLSWPRDQRHR